MKIDNKLQFRYTPDAGVIPEVEKVQCGVCGDVMNEKRGCYGPRSYGESMLGGGSYYDNFICPNHEESWHKQVVALRQEAQKTASNKLSELLDSEVQDILRNRKATK